jgi:hypothetical protein
VAAAAAATQDPTLLSCSLCNRLCSS